MNCSYRNFTADKTKFSRISSYDNFYLFLIYNSPANIHSSSKSAPSLGLGWYIVGATSYDPRTILVSSSCHPRIILVSSSCVYEDAQALYQS